MPKDEFDLYVERLQQEIIDNELKIYSARIVQLFHDPPNWGKPPEGEDIKFLAYEGPCGDTMEYFLKINNGVIEKVNFITDGCGASVAAGAQTTLLVEGKTLEQAMMLEPKDIDDALNGLPDDHKHCAELAIRTLRRIINQYKE